MLRFFLLIAADFFRCQVEGNLGLVLGIASATALNRTGLRTIDDFFALHDWVVVQSLVQKFVLGIGWHVDFGDDSVAESREPQKERQVAHALAR